MGYVLNINGEAFDGFKSLEATRTVEGVTNSFVATISPASTGKRSAFRTIALIGAPFSLFHNGKMLMQGFLDEVDGETLETSIAGRSKTADLVDCSAPVATFENQTIFQITRTLIAAFGLELTIRPEAIVPGGELFEKVSVEPGESYFDFIDRLALQRGLRFWSSATTTSGLVIGQPGDELSRFAIRWGQNIKTRSVKRSAIERYSEVTVLAPAAEADLFAGASGGKRAKGFAQDTSVGRFRPLVVVADQPGTEAELNEIAAAHLANLSAASFRAAYSVPGLVDPKKKLWPAGMLITVDDPEEGFVNEALLAATVVGREDENGQSTELQLVNPAALNRALEEEDDEDGGGFWS
jgi:prophage tail gpP-like protein